MTEPKIKERPILFSGAMVKAILKDRKSQTRRVVKPQPWEDNGRLYWTGANFTYDITPGTHLDRCPYGQPGDRLWVRETFAVWDGGQHARRGGQGVTFRADACKGDVEDGDSLRCRKDFGVKWKPSIFMPRFASRLTLEITAVRVERLQDLSEDDALAEGIDRELLKLCHVTPQNCYRKLWTGIHGPGSWDLNPWAWVLEFRKAP